MKTALKILQSLKATEKHYKQKVKLLTEIINEPGIGHLCPDELVKWCKTVGLKTESNHEDKCDWTTVSAK